MLLLPADVLLEALDMGNTHRESAVSLLPCETLFVNFLVNPFGRLLLDVAQDICKTVCGLKADQQMNVIVNATDCLGNTAQLPDTSAKVGVKTWSPIRRNQRHTVLRTEGEVVMKAQVSGVSMAFSNPPTPLRGSGIIPHPFPVAARDALATG